MRRPLIAGNWKMNGLGGEALALAAGVAEGVRRGAWADRDVLICPPATLIAQVGDAVRGSGVLVGGQDCHAKANGAHTGDISAEMLSDAGASHVIVGHSERRADHGETDAIVRAKAEAAWRAGLLPIVCIGETLAEREAGRTLAVLESQLKGSVPSGGKAATLVVAYEPVWAIGTGKTPTCAYSQGTDRPGARCPGAAPALRRVGERQQRRRSAGRSRCRRGANRRRQPESRRIFGYRQGGAKPLEARCKWTALEHFCTNGGWCCW
jgi:triosephosphate isomerase